MGKDFMELCDELNESAKLVKKEVKKIVEKGDLTPQELESLYKAACLAEKLMALGCDAGEMGDASYGYGYGHMNGYPYMSMGGYGNMGGYSEARGRSPVTGRYISRGMDGMSGHSIEDRMIAALEQQMDAAKTEYERKTIQDEIQRIRMGTR